MILFHFEIEAGRVRIPVELKAHDAADALARLAEALNCPVIAKAYAGNDEEGKTHYPELRGRQLFKARRESALFEVPASLILASGEVVHA